MSRAYISLGCRICSTTSASGRLVAVFLTHHHKLEHVCIPANTINAPMHVDLSLTVKIHRPMTCSRLLWHSAITNCMLPLSCNISWYKTVTVHYVYHKQSKHIIIIIKPNFPQYTLLCISQRKEHRCTGVGPMAALVPALLAQLLSILVKEKAYHSLSPLPTSLALGFDDRMISQLYNYSLCRGPCPGLLDPPFFAEWCAEL